MFRTTRSIRTGTLLGAGLLAAAVLTGCGGDSLVTTGPTTGGAGAAAPAGSAVVATPSTPSPAAPHNAADIAFANGLIPHHVQALASTQIAASNASNAEVKALAANISKAQVPEIESLSAWLTAWGEKVPVGAIGGGSAGGLTQNDLTKLSKTPAAQFDTLWLNTMIKHQQIALTLAQNEVKSGQSTEAKALATKIVKAQQADIATMKSLLKKP